MAEPVHRALSEAVSPANQSWVEPALSALEQSADVALVFLIAMEVLDHSALVRATGFSAVGSVEAT